MKRHNPIPKRWQVLALVIMTAGASLCLSGRSYAHVEAQQIPAVGRTIRIPFTYENGFLVVEVLFHHVFPLRFILDTGAEYTLLTHREISELLRFVPERTFSLIGADLATRVEADLIRGVDLELGGHAFPGRDILVTHDDYFRIHVCTGTPIHGIIGADILKPFVVRIDYRRKEVLLTTSSQYRVPSGAESIPLEIVRNKPYVSLPYQQTATDTATQIRLLLDTGAALSLLLLTDSHDAIRLPDRAVHGTLGVGLGGFIMGARGRIEAFGTPPINSRHLIANFQDIREYPDTSFLNGRHGLIGNRWLEQFLVILDYPGKRLHLVPGKSGRKEPPTDRSGLFVLASGAYLDRFVIHEVVPGSPGDLAGLLPGDEIRAINGWPAAWRKLTGIQRCLQGKPGKVQTINIIRGGMPMKVHLTLADYV